MSSPSTTSTACVPTIHSSLITGLDSLAVSFGGFGFVKRCTLRSNGGTQIVAVKLQRRNNPHSKESFEAEVRYSWKSEHANILRPIGILETEAGTAIAYPFCDGGALDECLWSDVKLDWVQVAREIASAVRWLHSQADIVLHNDIRAANVLIADSGTPLLSDFGAASQPGSVERRTFTHPSYLAPERIPMDTNCPATVKSDVYLFGMLLYEIFSDGLVPYNGLDVDTIVKTRSERPNPPRSMEASMTDAIWGLIETCWADCEKRILMTVVCDLLGNV